MKKNLFSIVLVMVALLLTGCNMSKSKLATEVASANATCPQKVDDGMTITSVEMDGDMVVFTYETNEQAFNNVSSNYKDPVLSKMMLGSIVAGLDKAFRDELVASKVGVKCVYICKSNGAKKEVELNSKELVDAIKHPLKGNDLLDMQIKIAQSNLPIDVGNGMKVVEFSRQGNVLRCVTDVTESKIDEATMKENFSNVSNSELFSKEDIKGDPLLETAVLQGMDILYVYKSDNFEEALERLITNKELQAILY